MTVWRRARGWRRGLSMVAMFLCSASMAATTDLPRRAPQEAYREIARTGYLHNVLITGDLDLAKLNTAAGVKRIELKGVELQGRLHSSGGGPAVPVLIDGATLAGIDLRGARVLMGFAIESGFVAGAARFDDAEFSGSFVLHAVRFEGKAVFRRAHFAGPVEIVACEFREPAGMTGGVSFADTRFAAPARFDRSRFATDVRFDTARFDADATFTGLAVAGRASWRNATFGGDAEFRFCRLGEVDFGDAEQMSVFAKLGDFRGCTMRSARFDYVDWRGDAMLVNVQVDGDLTLRNAALRGARADFTGLDVAGKLDLERAHIAALQFRWPDVAAAVLRAQPGSPVLRPLHRQLLALKQDDEARDVWAVLSDTALRERLAQPELSVLERIRLRVEQFAWGWTTGYGTQPGRIGALMLAAWGVLSLPLAVLPRVRLGRWTAALKDAPPRHQAVAPDQLQFASRGPLADLLARFGYGFGLMFAVPGLRLRPAQPQAQGMTAYLALMRGIGAVLLAVGALTLANVSPVLQAILGKVIG